jgi:hypothetical protein
MKIVFTYGGANPYDTTQPAMIVMRQSEGKGKLFRINYGVSVDDKLTYAKACKVLGEVMLHHLACEDQINNKGE